MPSKRALFLYISVMEAIACLELRDVHATPSKIHLMVERELNKRCRYMPHNLKLRVYKALKYGIQRGVLEKSSEGVRMTVGALSLQRVNRKRSSYKMEKQDNESIDNRKFKTSITIIEREGSSSITPVRPKYVNIDSSGETASVVIETRRIRRSTRGKKRKF